MAMTVERGAKTTYARIRGGKGHGCAAAMTTNPGAGGDVCMYVDGTPERCPSRTGRRPMFSFFLG